MFGWFKKDANWSSPVGDPESIDLIGKRKDGGVDVLVVVAHALDLSDKTREVLTAKLRNCCKYIVSAEFESEFGVPSEDKVNLIIRSDWEVPNEYIELMGKVATEENAPVSLLVKYQ